MARFRKNSRGQYSAKAKKEALRIYTEEGPGEAAKQTGISATTIRNWARRSGATVDREKRTQRATEAAAAAAAVKRERLKVECREKALELLDRFDRQHEYFVGKDGDRKALDNPQAGDIKDYAIAIGVLIDKAELLDGRATSREEHRSVDQLDREIDRLLSEVGSGDRSTA